MTSPGHKIGQILQLRYLRQYLSYSVDQKLKMSEMLMAIFLVYSPSGITSIKKVVGPKRAAILKILKYQTQLQFDPRYEKIVPNYAKNFFMVMTSSMTSQGGLKVSLYIHVQERLAPGANCKGNVSSINANTVFVFLGYTCQKTISMNYTFRDCRSKVNITGLLGDLGTNKQHCKLSQIQLFFYCDAIDNLTLRLWKFSDFCSRHLVGVVGDDIMFHILVIIISGFIWSRCLPFHLFICALISPSHMPLVICFHFLLFNYGLR